MDLRLELAGLLPDLRAYARFLVRDRAEADDLVQEALVRALAALPRFTPDAQAGGNTLRGWAFTILRHAFYEGRRRRQREVTALEAQRHVVPGEAAEIGRAEIADLQAMLWRLPPLLREALVLVGAQGLTYEEAAAICATPVGTMKARVSRARAQLARIAAPATSEAAGDGAPG